MEQDIKNNLTEKQTWIRGLYMLLFAACYSIAELILFAIIIFQFILTVLTRNSNDRLLKLGQSLSTYIYQIMLYLTFNSEQLPYPMGAWPKGAPANREKKHSQTAVEEIDR